MPGFYTMSIVLRGPCGFPGKEVSLAIVKCLQVGSTCMAQDESTSQSALHHGGHVDKVTGNDRSWNEDLKNVILEEALWLSGVESFSFIHKKHSE